MVISLNAFTQKYQVSGRLIDIQTGVPISYATVYINGTSNGAISDQEGIFNLNGVTLPSELILSHVSYQLKRISLQDPSLLENLQFTLDPKIVLLEQATVIHDNLREVYLLQFKSWFLGADYKKYRADILNDSALIFHIYEEDQFSVAANEPIIVDLPATGYRLKVDLVKFDLLYNTELSAYHCSILGYFFFNPVEPESPRKLRTIARNRTEHYYNSSMHFCRSLYHNQLAHNGYLFDQECSPPKENTPGNSFMHSMKASYGQDEYGNQQLLLTGFTCKKFGIKFYYNARNRPVDLTYLDSNPTRIEQSGLRFMGDSIHIYPTGRIPGNSILFSRTIATKGIASMLPEDYIPAMR